MKFPGLAIVVFLCFVTLNINAQSYELGKVTIAELQEKSTPKDTAAPAAILFKKGRTFFVYDKENGFVANHVYEFKIKIYNKKGLDWANQKIRYYVGYESISEDRLAFSDVVTYNLENNKIVKTKINNEGTFTKKVNKYWKEKAITFPNVKIGSIIEYKYVLKSENLSRFPDFEMQYDIPVNYFEYKTELPEVYIYKSIKTGAYPIETESKLVDGSQSFDNEHHKTKRLIYKQINTIYQGKDIPALVDEPYIKNLDNYRGAIKFELERIRYSDKPDKDYSLTWEGVATNIYKSDDFGKELNENSFLTEDVRRLLANVETPKEKLDVIFKFVQNKMNWNGINDCYSDKGIVKAYANQTGNVAEINFILINMLKLAGIEANPVLVSTIENGVPVYPTRIGFNYVIAAAEIDGKEILLDASHKFTTPDFLPLNVLNWKGRLIKKDGTSREIDLMPTALSRESLNLLVNLDAFGKINGKIRISRSEYEAYSFRVKNSGTNEENYLDKLEEQLGNLKISDYKIENKKTNLTEPVLETFSFESDNQTEIIDGKIFINPLLFYTSTKNPFNQEKRQNPIYFGYPSQQKFNLSIQIPAGYTVESLPSPIRISSENKEIVYMLITSSSENKIQISCSKEIYSSIFAEDQYNGLKDLFQKTIVSQNQKIVLKKI